jgi:HSP20 family protein
MARVRHVRVQWRGVLTDVRSIQLWRAAAHTWEPAINAFRCERGVRICVDLAGVEKSSIDLSLEGRRVVVRGSRTPPEPTSDRAVQLLALEIDYGPFEREIDLPIDVDVKRAHAEQENGLLWITLPVKK